MPFKSEAQRKFMYAVHPEIAKRWSKEEKMTPIQKAAKARIKQPNPEPPNSKSNVVPHSKIEGWAWGDPKRKPK